LPFIRERSVDQLQVGNRSAVAASEMQETILEAPLRGSSALAGALARLIETRPRSSGEVTVTDDRSSIALSGRSPTEIIGRPEQWACRRE
jgi:hypothetical protein